MNAAGAIATRPLKLLIVEDSPDDALLLVRALRKGGYLPESVRVDTPEAMLAALGQRDWDIVISDYTMPEFSGMQALEIAKRHDPDLPVIVVSGNIGEEVAVGAMRAGAQDYLLKQNLTRLAPAVTRELDEAATRRRNKETELALQQNKERLNGILGSIGDIVWSIGLPSLRMEYLNEAVGAIYGRPATDIFGNAEAWLAAVHPDDRERMRHYIGNAVASGENSAEYRIVRPDGEVRWLFDRCRVIVNERGRRVRVDGIASDISVFKQQQALLYQVAHHDALTGLPNRALMQDRLRQALASHQRSGETLALMFIDIDRFKTINDSLGHKAGDAVLCEIARRLTASLRAEDTVARLGGDEFVVILPHLASEGSMAGIAQKLMRAIAPPIDAESNQIHCTASIGIAHYPRDADGVEALLKNADAAMYEAKRAGRNTFRYYAAAMNAAATRQLRLENALRGAAERNELEIHYQPQLDLARNGALSGFEALLRWRHPELGQISPVEFIPIAEECGLIVPIGEWVLAESCRQAKAWVARFDPNLRMAVNLSARQFGQPDLPETIGRILKESGLPARNLELELTESVIMQDCEHSLRTLGELKAMGITLAVDDFGTGYSSLAYLKRFPIDVLKIDKSFVAEIASNPDDAAICSSIVAMSHSLRLTVVAEGVENRSQLGFLVQQLCDRAQGFLFSKPLGVEAAEDLLCAGFDPDVLPTVASAPARSLLLLDDEENILTSLKRLLRRDGYHILTASSAAQAFELLAAHKVGVIISDQRMPKMTGTEFLNRVKDLYPDTVRIVLSGYTDLQSVIQSINEGSIYRFLTKPWDDDQLRAAIREAFRQQALAEENAKLNLENRQAAARLEEMNRQLQELLLEKSSRIERDEALVGAAQEAFYHVPVPLVGLDDNGMIVLANRRALALWPHALPGAELNDALPAALAGSLLGVSGEAPLSLDIGGGAYLAHRQRIESPAGGAGWLISFLPARQADDAGPGGGARTLSHSRVH